VLQVAARPADVEALRLLGESRLLNAEPAKSVSAYEKAIALAPNDQSLITVSIQLGLGLT
jgi:cytochrome c-type biogenesis protein CcmH/NrfG